MKMENRRHQCRLSLAAMLALAFVAMNVSAASVPSIDEVYRTARAGDLVRADSMMQQVLRAYPRSARAHYAYAQILAAEGKTPDARAQLDEAKSIAPGLPFANPRSVTSLEHKLRMMPAPANKAQSIPSWLWIALAGGLALLLIRWLARRRSASMARSYPNPGAPQSGAGFGYGGAPQSAGYGGGLWGSILSGLGFGAGAAAGGYAVDRLLHPDRTQGEMANDNLPEDTSSNLGGNDFGVTGGNDPGSSEWSDQGSNQAGDANDFDISGGDGGGWDDSGSGGTDV
jgi:tetratricopeptide repeat protein